jgi:hypothetical protein
MSQSSSYFKNDYYHSYHDAKPISSYEQYYRAMAASLLTPPRHNTGIVEPVDVAVRRYAPILGANMPSWFKHKRNPEATSYAAHAAHLSMWEDVHGRRAQEVGWRYVKDDGYVRRGEYMKGYGYGGREQYVNSDGYGAREQYAQAGRRRLEEEEEQMWWYGRRDRWVGAKEKEKEKPRFRKDKMYIVRRRERVS